MTNAAWTTGTWLNEPVHRIDGADLLVEAAKGSDFWRTTSYGFVRDSGHALLRPLQEGEAATVSFVADLPALYDQAGVLVRVDGSTGRRVDLGEVGRGDERRLPAARRRPDRTELGLVDGAGAAVGRSDRHHAGVPTR